MNTTAMFDVSLARQMVHQTKINWNNKKRKKNQDPPEGKRTVRCEDIHYFHRRGTHRVSPCCLRYRPLPRWGWLGIKPHHKPPTCQLYSVTGRHVCHALNEPDRHALTCSRGYGHLVRSTKTSEGNCTGEKNPRSHRDLLAVALKWWRKGGKPCRTNVTEWDKLCFSVLGDFLLVDVCVYYEFDSINMLITALKTDLLYCIKVKNRQCKLLY